MKGDINTEQETLFAVRRTNALKTVSINDLAKSFAVSQAILIDKNSRSINLRGLGQMGLLDRVLESMWWGRYQEPCKKL